MNLIGPYPSAEIALDEIRKGIADVLGEDPATWPSGHGNVPLAIVSAFVLMSQVPVSPRMAPLVLVMSPNE
jgi:hypothetical protein